MADNAQNGSQDAAAALAAQQQIKQRILAQFVRDMSFENIMAQKGVEGEVNPEIKVEVAMTARKRTTENQYEVLNKVKVTSTNKGTDAALFLLELDYAGIFHIEGVPEEQLHPYLHIECPRQLFPFIRRIVNDVTRDGGFPPLNLEQIDYLSLYRNQLVQQMEANKKKADA